METTRFSNLAIHIINTLHPGYNDMDFLRSQIIVSKLSVYPESNTDVTGVIGFMRSDQDNILSITYSPILKKQNLHKLIG